MGQYSCRRFRSGDEQVINDLYHAVTGRFRSIEEYRWQWLSAPAGPGEICLIECEGPRGDVQLIGHHGIMPLRFSIGEHNLVLGKTENTMVHPEFRSKILYPRYEQKFLREYEGRYDALFSTMGPPAALRQRRALGYKAENHWMRYEWVLRPGANLDKAARVIANRKAGLVCQTVVQIVNMCSAVLCRLYRFNAAKGHSPFTELY